MSACTPNKEEWGGNCQGRRQEWMRVIKRTWVLGLSWGRAHGRFLYSFFHRSSFKQHLSTPAHVPAIFDVHLMTPPYADSSVPSRSSPPGSRGAGVWSGDPWGSDWLRVPLRATACDATLTHRTFRIPPPSASWDLEYRRYVDEQAPARLAQFA